MKKLLIFSGISLALIALAVSAFGLTGRAFAQEADPTESVPAVRPEDGLRGGRGPMQGERMPFDTERAEKAGQLETYMLAAQAEAFGISVEELQALHEDGQTLWDLAITQDLTVAEFQAKLDSARQNALEAAVTDGVLTQEQADAMQSRMGHGMNRPGGRGHGRGGCPQMPTPEDTDTNSSSDL